MSLLTFFPGPSKVDPNINVFLQEAYDLGILSLQHRSSEFMVLVKKTIDLLKAKLNIPKDYKIVFTGSATECWEILSQAFIEHFSLHVTTGAFGEKWYSYRCQLAPNAAQLRLSAQKIVSINAILKFKNLKPIICLTQNETSNGTQVKNKLIRKIKTRIDPCLIFVDATSYMGGNEIDWRVGDVFFASVQKCFGLPPGLGIMVCSPRAILEAEKLNHKKHYNNLPALIKHIRTYQTPYTPNTLGIFLLKKVLEKRPDITLTNKILKERAKEVNRTLIKNRYKPFIINSSVRSDTVLIFEDDKLFINDLKKKAIKVGIQLGNGYGHLKNTTFRIANFPAYSDKDFEKLINFLMSAKQDSKMI